MRLHETLGCELRCWLTVWVAAMPQAIANDVADVRVRGDSTLMGMRIEEVRTDAGGFTVRTTGARFVYRDEQLMVEQGLNRPRRRLATLRLEPAPRFRRVAQSDDHVLFASSIAALGVYGDSTVLLSARRALRLTARGSFRPTYSGRLGGELLLIDDRGGIEIYPQRHEAGYQVLALDANREAWTADYALRPRQRVMIAAFPPRPFDWERSFRREVVIVYGSDGKAPESPYGQMPPDATIRAMARNFDILIVWHRGLYVGGGPSPPWRIANPAEFRRLIRTARGAGLRVVPYSSYFYSYRKFRDDELYFRQAAELVRDWGVDGLYIDGLRFDYGGDKLSDRIAIWEMIRRLRQLVGRDGVLVFHGTHRGSPVATAPNIDTYCDVTIYGEKVPLETLNDPYLRYQVRKYGISNTVGTWLWHSARPRRISWQACVDAMVRMNCRGLSWSHMKIVGGRYVWSDGLTSYFRYYRMRIAELERRYRQRVRAQSATRPALGQEDRAEP